MQSLNKSTRTLVRALTFCNRVFYRIEQRISAKKRKVGFSTDSCWAYSKLRQESENSGANWFRQVRDLDFFRLLKK